MHRALGEMVDVGGLRFDVVGRQVRFVSPYLLDEPGIN